jgi:short-subunit dehydrogenase involved in D-alanine esterification of teichoic acids
MTLRSRPAWSWPSFHLACDLAAYRQAHKYATSTSPAFKKVIVTGRKADTIAEVAKEDDKFEGVAFDPNELSAIPAFVTKMVEHEGVNHVIVTAGESAWH